MSIFADTLRALLDETDMFNRVDWAKFAGVTLGKIKRWLADKELPRADHLFMIHVCLKDSHGIREKPVKAFEEMLDLPARQVSPLGSLMLPTVRQYMNRPIFSDLSTQLARRTPKEQKQLLEKLYPA